MQANRLLVMTGCSDKVANSFLNRQKVFIKFNTVLTSSAPVKQVLSFESIIL